MTTTNPETVNRGVVVAVRGSVVDMRFDEYLPPIYSVLHAGEEDCIVIEVLAQRDTLHVRGIALTPTQGLARGMAVKDTGGPLKAPVGKGIFSRMFDVFGNAIDRESAPADVVHQAFTCLEVISKRSLRQFTCNQLQPLAVQKLVAQGPN